MSIQCLFGHKWDGCKCEKCGKVRNEGHVFENYFPISAIGEGADNICRSKCSRCGEYVNDLSHDFARDPQKCYQECRRCGYKTEPEHSMEQIPGICREKCVVCGEERNLPHVWKQFKGRVRCSRCGETNAEVFMDDCVTRLLAIFPDSSLDYEGHRKFDTEHREEVRRIGEQLDALGGIRAMRRVGEAFAAKKPIHARKLETTWNGIGNWMG